MLAIVETQDVVQSKLKVLIHEKNTERVRRGKKPLTIRLIAELTSTAESTLTGLTANRSKGVQFETLQALCRFFNCTPGDILEYLPENPERAGNINDHTPELARHVHGHAAVKAAVDYAQRKLLQDPWLEAE